MSQLAYPRSRALALPLQFRPRMSERAAAHTAVATRPFTFTGCVEPMRQNFLHTRHPREYTSLLARLVTT